MSDPIIKVEGVGKKYILSHEKAESYTALRDVISRKAKRLIRKTAEPELPPKEDFWAVKDISFEVQKGEMLGIIGRNGAGKSTLLKLLSRITEPTTGRIELNGRVASLLEVGTGFHPELTGRENIFLNGAILGMSRNEIRRKFDEIVEFAGVAKFLDTPVKRYSSGMYVRLAFAVAAHLEPEILVVDEVLAVGDAEFQKKCLGKMEEVSQKEGRTVLFVSHNMAAVKSLCKKGILLTRGAIEFEGPAQDVVSHYLSIRNVAIYESKKRSTNNAYIKEIEIVNGENDFDLGEDVVIRCCYVVNDNVSKLSLSLALYNGETNYVLDSPSGTTEYNWSMKIHEHGVYEARCTIPGNFLNVGTYYPSLILVEDGRRPIEVIKDVLSFNMVDRKMKLNYFGPWGGVVRPLLNWQIQKMTS